jgi:hypothetical protein
MISFDMFHHQFTGPSGQLAISDRDEISLKLAMLIEGECGSGPTQAAAKFGFCRQRYFQLRAVFREKGARGLAGQKQGPKTNYRRTEELVSQVIRHRFLDVEASSEVITQKLKQCGFAISKRSVDRVLAQFGLQKKTLSVLPGSASGRRNPVLSHANLGSVRKGRFRQPGTGSPPTIGQ